ncbi:MAG: gamma-glutamylcyclotransferase [Porticoccaceae bacterium]|nr:gamma-glutamylcyclotransferase [Porticoccaceae bacterium]
MPYYFAYGSNMNPARMAQRGLAVEAAMPGRLEDMVLRFNKRSRHNPRWGCANIAWARGNTVEGVLYRLADPDQIVKMDPFEGAPRYYSRERFPVITGCGEVVHAWTYVANRANIDEGVMPLRWYLGQLLAGREFLSNTYLAMLESVPCLDEHEQGWG